ncbi:MAG: HD domain-containing protein [Syntrophales bacterium]
MLCPGQDTRFWKPTDIFEIPCPKCGQAVEFFKNDTVRNCPKCSYRFVNPKLDFGCASYCEYAEQCLGTLPPELLAQKKDLFKDRIAVEMKRYFKNDFKKIGQAMRVARYADRIGKEEHGNLAVILTSAYLHDIGMIEAETKYGDRGEDFHEQEGPAVARTIMCKLNADNELIDEVCDIIAHHHKPRAEESINFKVIHDAGLVTDLEEQQKKKAVDIDKLKEIIETSFLTDSGRKVAREVLISKRNDISNPDKTV